MASQSVWEDPRVKQIQAETEGQIRLLNQFQLPFQREQLAQQKELAMMQNRQAERGLDLQQAQFDWRKGMANSFIGQMPSYLKQSQANLPTVYRGEEINVGPVFNEEQMAQQQNMVRDRSMRQAGGVANRMQSQYAARGYGGNSPLLRSMAANLETQGRVGGETGALQFAGQMATENAKNMLSGQQLRQGQTDAYNQALLNRAQVAQAGTNQLLALISGMVGI